MFCPNCRAEYTVGVVKCADCDVALVAELTPTDDNADYIDLVTVGVFTNAPELAVAKSLLEDADIQYFAKNEGVIGLFSMGQVGYNPMVGGIEIQVHPDDADAAREILAQMAEADADMPIDLSSDDQ
jgi:hypothetical protein